MSESKSPQDAENTASAKMEQPEFSVVIPVYNEESIIVEAIEELVGELEQWGRSYEIIIAENGSKDQTIPLAQDLSERLAHVSYFSASEANYGRALKEGLQRAQGIYAICDEIDLCDTRFYRAAFDIHPEFLNATVFYSILLHEIISYCMILHSQYHGSTRILKLLF